MRLSLESNGAGAETGVFRMTSSGQHRANSRHGRATTPGHLAHQHAQDFESSNARAATARAALHHRVVRRPPPRAPALRSSESCLFESSDTEALEGFTGSEASLSLQFGRQLPQQIFVPVPITGPASV